MVEKSKQSGLLFRTFEARKTEYLGANAKALATVFAIAAMILIYGSAAVAQSPTSESQVSRSGNQTSAANVYRPRDVDESEFDNLSEAYVKDWREAMPVDEYDDTEFGDLLYNEASTPTKLEILRLLSKDTPSILVFMTAVSMGLDIESVLQASIKYQPEKSRDLAGSAVNLLPLLSDSGSYLYSSYELEDLPREDETKPYSVATVVENFFEDRSVLRPYPDWFEGQYHFLASAAELKSLQTSQKNRRWYRTKSTQEVRQRPIFVSLYEHNKSVLIDGEDRIDEALRRDPDAQLPVVFVFNRLNERAIDDLGYPLTIRGVQDAYSEQELMVTAAPEWQIGEYHLHAKIDEFYEIFELPEEEDFEPEAWQNLLSEAEDYLVADTAFIMVVLGGGDGEHDASTARLDTMQLNTNSAPLYAAWDDPRTEEAFPYVVPKDASALTLESIMAGGLIVNRPDLIAALNALGVKSLPIAFYYLDSARTKPFNKTPRALIQAALGVNSTTGTFDGGGITPPPPAPPVCASPPCSQ